MGDLRICRVCKWVKPESEFYPQQGAECKECTKKRVKATRAAKIDHYRDYDRKRAPLPHRRAQNASIGKRWRAEHPLRRAAQVALGNAIRDGRIEKQPCFVCGAKAEAHHPVYDLPLDVVWLCPPHHKQAHALAKDQS